MNVVASLLSEITNQLPGETPALDAQVLLTHITGHNRAWLLAHPEAQLTPEQQKAFETCVKRIQDGVPLPYIIGHWEFFGLDFDVTSDVLIPRPETELLVEAALDWIRSQPQPTYRFVDVGTGSGCIAIALAFHVPRAEIAATDISPAALAIARRNAQRHGVDERIYFMECDLLSPDIDISECNLVAANLPYIPSTTLKELPIYGREPSLALDGGPDGLGIIRRLLALLTAKMEKGSLLLLEIENRQGAAARSLTREAFPMADIQIKKDLSGNDRLVIVEI